MPLSKLGKTDKFSMVTFSFLPFERSQAISPPVLHYSFLSYKRKDWILVSSLLKKLRKDQVSLSLRFPFYRRKGMDYRRMKFKDFTGRMPQITAFLHCHNQREGAEPGGRI